ncbi:MAG: aldose epimerase [Planctomycetes bacterium]|nr:aldose epimerase [Planctomycetota bacterium]
MLKSDDGASWIEFAPERGGIATRAAIDGREILYFDESTFLDTTKNVRGGIPILFPIAGPLEGGRAAFEGAEIRLPRHGFAREQPWTFVDADVNIGKLAMRFASNDSTRAMYPYEFELIVSYQLFEHSIGVESCITNTGARPMPAQIGFHPYFNFSEADKSVARIEAVATRAFDNLLGKIVDYKSPALAGGEVDYHILDPNGGAVRLRNAPGRTGVRLDYGGFPCAVVWTLPGKDFVCLEPWSGPAKSLNTGEGLIRLRPGQSDWRRWFVQIEIDEVPKN